ncbi:hypothetical protein [Natrialba sp. INN-245]|uniref:hypothetical protein n=1 Tax=Natrialba sp. INN-245 TaxID=2690967 RepID=UPI001312435F|nr:hypothetical protein [Natrialba sp. INN-245]MWV40808.1 hypothetical protein [Natrialba sp. INN-245]
MTMVAGCTGSEDETDDEPDEPERPEGDGQDEPTEPVLNEEFTPGVDDSELEELDEPVYFTDVVEYESSFAVDLQLSSPEPATGVQRVHDGNYYVHIDSSEPVEMYGVDGTLYTIVMGHCDVDGRDPEQGQYVPIDQSRDDTYGSLAAAGTTTIDGEEVYVFEHPVTTEYLSTDTGYPVRSEWAGTRADYHSWGEVDPISPPDRPCNGE